MTKGFLFRAVTVSAVVAFLLPFIYTVLFRYSVVYDPPMDPAEFHAKTYEEQQKWLKEGTITLNGWQTLRSRLTEKRFWIEFGEFFAMSFLALLVACVTFGLWQASASRSNQSLNRTRANDARPG